jgi:lysophospholipase L1-like esterase
VRTFKQPARFAVWRTRCEERRAWGYPRAEGSLTLHAATKLFRRVLLTALAFPAIVSRRRRSLKAVVAAVVFVAAGLAAHTAAFAGHGNEQWVTTWSTALHGPNPGFGITNPGFGNQTLRQIVHTSVGGDEVRVRLSTFGASALVVGAAHIARHDAGAAIVAGSDRVLTFSGNLSITIPAGAVVLSDPVDLDVPALGDLAVSLFVPANPTGPANWHFEGLQTSYISPMGDFTASIDMPVATTALAWFWLAAVEVTASRQTGVIVAIGDSLTDGTNSTPDTNNRWPDHLARRLMAQPGHHDMGVLNEGIAGNRVLQDVIGPNALARFDRDVLAQTGVTHVIVLEGLNDITFGVLGFPVPTADELIAGHRQLIERAHARGLSIVGGTITPFEGSTRVPGSFTPETEAERQAVNHWIRTSGEYDGVIDFDKVVRDPAHPTRLLPAYDSGDHSHPNDAGYRAMANAIDLRLFELHESR